MAKKKGGLGRGLNALLGDSSILGDAQAQSSAIDGAGCDDTASGEGEFEQRLIRQQLERDIFDAQAAKARPYIEEDDHAQIMGVVSRERKVGEVTEAKLSEIQPNPDQPRSFFKREEIEELADSISRDGLLQPILVRDFEGKYQIIAGERRYQACKKLGMETVPVRVREVPDDKVMELALIENIQRSDLNPIEEAYGYKHLMERKGMTQTEVAQAVS